jgi:hypothetical protein
MAASFAEIFLEAMRYEHWLRFYFADDAPLPEGVQEAEEGQDAVIAVPAAFAEQAHTQDTELAEILDALQGQIITMERSRDAVFACLGRRSGMAPGSASFNEQLAALSADMDFRRELDWFHGWVQELANNEIDLKGNALPPGAPRDDRIPSFAEWDAAFKFCYSLQKPLGEISPPAH